MTSSAQLDTKSTIANMEVCIVTPPPIDSCETHFQQVFGIHCIIGALIMSMMEMFWT